MTFTLKSVNYYLTYPFSYKKITQNYNLLKKKYYFDNIDIDIVCEN